MRDQRFVAVHRGGLLRRDQHNLLIHWACGCVLHVLPLLAEQAIDKRVTAALDAAIAWGKGALSVGNARKASVAVIAAANAASDPVAIAIARAAGHAVATAHMADHCLGAADYALKAIRADGQSIEPERQWQHSQLPETMRMLVVTTREKRPRVK